MPRVDQSTINWAVYEDNTEYAGMAQATLPNLTALTQSIQRERHQRGRTEQKP